MANSIDIFIKTNLGERTLQKIEDRLSKKYNLTITQALLEPDKLDDVFREFFGEGAEGLERKITKFPS